MNERAHGNKSEEEKEVKILWAMWEECMLLKYHINEIFNDLFTIESVTERMRILP
jgi:hypothetical protein